MLAFRSQQVVSVFHTAPDDVNATFADSTLVLFLCWIERQVDYLGHFVLHMELIDTVPYNWFVGGRSQLLRWKYSDNKPICIALKIMVKNAVYVNINIDSYTNYLVCSLSFRVYAYFFFFSSFHCLLIFLDCGMIEKKQYLYHTHSQEECYSYNPRP